MPEPMVANSSSLMQEIKRSSDTLASARYNIPGRIQPWRALIYYTGLAFLVSALTASAQTNLLISEVGQFMRSDP